MGEGDGEMVRFEHDKVVWEIPRDLIELQRSWFAADGACQALASGDDLEALKSARAHRLELTMALQDHPWLLQALSEGRRHQADMAMKACAHAQVE